MSTIKFEIPNVHCTNMVVVEHIGGIRYKIRYNMADHSDVYPKFKSILEEEYECTAYVFVDGGISESSDTRYIYHDMLVTNLSGETVPAGECIDVGSRLAVTVESKEHTATTLLPTCAFTTPMFLQCTFLIQIALLKSILTIVLLVR